MPLIYVDDPLRTTIITTKDFSLAKKNYIEQKMIPNPNRLRHEISILIYIDGLNVAYISNNGKLQSLDYFDTLDVSLNEISEYINWNVEDV